MGILLGNVSLMSDTQQSNWNQFDENSADFIKNKPFGVNGYNIKTINWVWEENNIDPVILMDGRSSFNSAYAEAHYINNHIIHSPEDLIGATVTMLITANTGASNEFNIILSEKNIKTNTDKTAILYQGSPSEDSDDYPNYYYGDSLGYILATTQDNVEIKILSPENDITNTAIIPKAGIYLIKYSTGGSWGTHGYCQSVSGGIKIPIIQTIDKKYLPEEVANSFENAKTYTNEVIVTKADKTYVDTKIADLVNSAPETLDTLGELATAFGENKEVVDALNESIINKQNKNVIVYRDAETEKASMTAPQIMEKVRAGENVYYTTSLSGGTLHPYLEGSDTGVFFYSNYIDNDRVIGTGILINGDGTITSETYQLGHLKDNVIHITSEERNRWNDTYTKTETDNLLEAKAEDSVKKYFLIVETIKQNDNYLLDGITFNEILEKFNAGNVNMVCHVDGTDYIPLLSVTPNKIMFSGIYQTTSVSLDFSSNGVGILTSMPLANQNRFQNYYTKEETNTKIADLVNSAPETLDTLGELATALQENEEIVNVLNEAITNKADKDEVAQSDWNQNDVYAPGYVQNRTHWVDYAETILDSEVFECTTLASDSESYYCAKSGNIGLISGRKYKVTVNGTKYTVSALSTFGTKDVSLIAEIDTCRIYDRENGTVEVFTDSSATLTITIEEAEDIYVPLDEKFIPDVFARKTDIELKLDKENPIGSGALSINRAANSEIGENSIAIGTDCVASGESAIAMGSEVSAIGFASHAEGSGSIAEGILSHAEGQDSVATGYASHAENSGEANGNYSHAEGYSIADGDYSHTSGNGTWAVGRSQTVIGEANQEDEAEDSATRGTYAFIVGNGDMDAGEYSNASTLDWEGNAWFAGDVYIGSTEGYNKDEGSKKLATEEYVNSVLASLNYETWTFTLSDGTTVTKQVLIK